MGTITSDIDVITATSTAATTATTAGTTAIAGSIETTKKYKYSTTNRRKSANQNLIRDNNISNVTICSRLRKFRNKDDSHVDDNDTTTTGNHNNNHNSKDSTPSTTITSDIDVITATSTAATTATTAALAASTTSTTAETTAIMTLNDDDLTLYDFLVDANWNHRHGNLDTAN